jgi:segregation and condensation protein B
MQRHYGQVLRGPLAQRPRDRFGDAPPAPEIYRWLDDSAEPRAQGELARDEKLALVEAALLAADEPLTPRRLVTAAGVADAAEARRLVRKLQSYYEQDGTAFQVEEIAGGFQLLSRVDFHPWLVRLRRAHQEIRLTAAMRETLAIVAYRQPIMRADIEKVRGVHCGEVLNQLMERNLIRIAGRDPSLGRPMLYGTTKKFLQVFGLKSLRDLPGGGELRAPATSESPKTDSPEAGPDASA